MIFLCLFFWIPPPINIKIPDKISSLTGKSHPCLISSFGQSPLLLFSLFAFFKHLNNKQPVSTISVKTQTTPGSINYGTFFFSLSIHHLRVSSKKSFLQGSPCLWTFLRWENGAEEGLAMGGLAFLGVASPLAPHLKTTLFYLSVYLSHKFIVTVQPTFGL